MAKKERLADVEAEWLHSTDKAILFKNLKGREVWVPKSRCEIDPEKPHRRGLTVTLTADEELLTEEEFI